MDRGGAGALLGESCRRRQPESPFVQSFGPWFVAAAVTWIVLTSLWLLLRRFSGAWHEPLSVAGLLVIVSVMGMASCALLAFVRRLDTFSSPAWRSVVLRLLAGSCVAVAAATSSVAGTSQAGMAITWILTTGLIVALGRQEHLAVRQEQVTETRSSQDAKLETSDVADLSRDMDDDDLELPAGVDQQLTIGRTESGQAFLEGRVRIELPAGQRNLHYHLAICPPWDQAPEVQAEQVDGPDIELHVGMVVPQGIRFDIRRMEAIDDPGSVIIEFYGHEPVPGTADPTRG